MNDGTIFFNSPIFSIVKCLYCKSAKYRTIEKNFTIVDPFFPSFLQHHCLQILYTTRECFYMLYNREMVWYEVLKIGCR